MIDLEEARAGDCVYVLVPCQATPIFAEIKKILHSENAIEIWTDMWGRRIVISDNAYWAEKEAKRNKIVKVQYNYKDWIREMHNHEETETDNRIDSLQHGQPKECQDSGKSTTSKDLPKRTKRKQKVVRKSSTKERKTKRNRKTRRKKE